MTKSRSSCICTKIVIHLYGSRVDSFREDPHCLSPRKAVLHGRSTSLNLQAAPPVWGDLGLLRETQSPSKQLWLWYCVVDSCSSISASLKYLSWILKTLKWWNNYAKWVYCINIKIFFFRVRIFQCQLMCK